MQELHSEKQKEILSVAFDSGGEWLAAAGDKYVYVWSLRTGAMASSAPPEFIAAKPLPMPSPTRQEPKAQVKLKPRKEPRNIGFLKDIPPELGDAFPLCDQFLDVRWIDPERYVGKAMVDVTNHVENTVERVYCLIELGAPGTDAMFRRGDNVCYRLTKEQFESQELDSFLQGATWEEVFGLDQMRARARGELREFRPVLLNSAMPQIHRALADLEENVCLVYPDQTRALFIELHRPFDPHNETPESLSALQRITEELSQPKKVPGYGVFEPRFDESRLKEWSFAMDINRDGLQDYLFIYGIGGGIGRSRWLPLGALVTTRRGLSYVDLGQRTGVGGEAVYYDAQTQSLFYDVVQIAIPYREGR